MSRPSHTKLCLWCIYICLSVCVRACVCVCDVMQHWRQRQGPRLLLLMTRNQQQCRKNPRSQVRHADQNVKLLWYTGRDDDLCTLWASVECTCWRVKLLTCVCCVLSRCSASVASTGRQTSRSHSCLCLCAYVSITSHHITWRIQKQASKGLCFWEIDLKLIVYNS